MLSDGIGETEENPKLVERDIYACLDILGHFSVKSDIECWKMRKKDSSKHSKLQKLLYKED